MRCAGMVALVTGGQQGIGRAIALALASEGADIVLNYLDDPDVAAGIALVAAAGGTFEVWLGNRPNAVVAFASNGRITLN